MTDTIFALSTAAGLAGVAVFRISGPAAGQALEALGGSLPSPRQAALAALRDPGDGAEIDRALILWFPAPRSFTGEDVAELHVHGGRSVQAGVVKALSALDGLRPAEAGEFTRRAFDNGKLDLSEVEGLADLIAAETEAQRRQALRQMDGGLSRVSEAWKDHLLRILAYLEALIDFPEEDLPETVEREIGEKLAVLEKEISGYLDDAAVGERLRDGLSVAILGAPNAGKSSLLNALAKREAAIVSEFAGTTRDVVEVHLDLGGYPVTLADTAGLRDLEDTAEAQIELEGIRRAHARAEAADLKIVVFDLGRWPELDAATLALLDENSLVVLNKSDLLAPGAQSPQPQSPQPQSPQPQSPQPQSPGPLSLAGQEKLGGYETILLSARNADGLAALIEGLTRKARDLLEGAGEAAVITRSRHRVAFLACLEALQRARGLPLAESELVAEDLRLAIRALGRIAGKVDVEDLLDVIFRDFCIGK